MVEIKERAGDYPGADEKMKEGEECNIMIVISEVKNNTTKVVFRMSCYHSDPRIPVFGKARLHT